MRLFWKLFLTLGVAMTVATVAAVTMGWHVGQLAFEQYLDLGFENREAIINRASQALNRGGRDELTSWLRQNQTPLPGRKLLIVDQSGDDLLGRELSREARVMLWQGIARDRDGEDRARGDRLWDDRRWDDYGSGRNRMPPQYSERLTSPNGELFRAIFEPTQLTLLNILRLPATQVGVVTLAIIMAAATALLLAKSLSSPIVRLQRATRALAAGALEARVGAPFDRRKDEVGTLARDFDVMAEKVQALITDKEVLLRDVSHELRSPLARIRVALALAQRKADVSAQEDLERIDQETERLDQLVGQILTLARLRSSRLEQHVDVDPATLVGEVVADARFEQADADISFETGDVPTIKGNPGELASAIENVLRNALVHSGPKARVDVKLESRTAPAEAVITISDRGPGVPDDDLKRLFEPFFRVDPSRDHKQTGYGLGLAIAARIIEHHGGRIEARNRPGGGLAVSFRLPARRDH